MAPDQELERFFRGFSQVERDNVEWWPEYQKAIKAKDTIAAMEIASAIITSPHLTIDQLKKVFLKKYPHYSE